jgi:cell wall-associated NlpC family hydrolase
MYATRDVTNPDGTEIRKNGRRVALFTNGAQTVTLAGPQRSFRDDDVKLTHSIWVRLAPSPHIGAYDEQWLDAALAANESEAPDVLAIASQYLKGAPPIQDGSLVIAGEAAYGPKPSRPPDALPEEGSDFNDFLGISWQYPNEQPSDDAPETRQAGCLDCSGYVRMVFGYRMHEPNASSVIALSRGIVPQGLPRRAHQMFSSAPGLLLTLRVNGEPPDFAKLRPGDLAFFKADDGDPNDADHVGIFIGADLDGGLRFVSSRKKANGPNFVDKGGASVLTGHGLYARCFVGARRL